MGICKICGKDTKRGKFCGSNCWNKYNKERMKEIDKKYRKNNKNKIKERINKYKQKNGIKRV